MANRVIYTSPIVRNVIYTKPYDAEVEYLKHGGKYAPIINTQVKLSSNIRFETKLIIGSEAGYVFGYNIKNDNIISLHFNYWRWGKGGALHNLPKNEIITLSTLDEPNVLKMNGSVVASTSFSEFTSDLNFLLFSGNESQSMGIKNNQIYYFKMYDGGLLVRDFIPVRKGNIGYMFDKVTHRLFGSINEHKFTLGNDIRIPPPQRNVIYSN